MRTLAALTALALMSCNPTVCGRATCDDPGARVTFDHEAWADGGWSVQITWGDETLTCTFNLPVADLDGAYCADGRVALTYVDGAPASAWISGEPPDSVPVLVQHTAEEVTTTALDASVPVEQGEAFPNGPGCPPGCPTYDLTLAF
jgi:hypothetical protein